MANIVRDVFKDYKEQNNIIDAEIENVNLFKKSKKLEVKLKTVKSLNIRDIESFEKYLTERFQIEKVEFDINVLNVNETTNFDEKLKEDWKCIVSYLSKKIPLTKAILKSSSVEIKDNKVIVVLENKNAEFLHSYEMDKELEKIIKNTYGRKVKVEYKENITEEGLKKQSEYLEKLEKNACQDLMNEINLQNEIAAQIKQKEKEAKEAETQEDGKKPLIFGRTDKIKEQVVKIEDLTSDYGRVALEGKVISVDSRELKNGKTLAMFNVYDGTSTITCKSFIEADKAGQVIGRLKQAKRVKIQGNAQYDNFAKELRSYCKYNHRNARYRGSKENGFCKRKKSRTPSSYSNESNGWSNICY